MIDIGNAAFNKTEKKMIQKTQVNTNDSWCGADGGNNTKDKVFLLQLDDVDNSDYGFSDDDSRICFPTSYALAQGVQSFYNDACWWWLRSPGGDNYFPALIEFDGMRYAYGDYRWEGLDYDIDIDRRDESVGDCNYMYYYHGVGVRPVMLLKI